MPTRIPQSVAIRVPLKGYLSADHVSDATGLDPAIVISKNGGAFGNPAAGATVATEISVGWYYVDLGTGDTDTLGPLIVRGTHATMDATEIVYQVVAATNGGFSALPAAAADAAGGLPISDAGALDLDAKIGALTFTVANQADVNVKSWLGTAGHAATVAGVPVVQLHDSAGAGGINAPANFEDLNITDTTGLVRPDMANASGNYAGTVATVTTLTNAVTLANGAHGGAATVITLQTPIVANATQIEGGDATNALEAAATASIVAANLDHLCLTATAAADMTAELADNTILSRIIAAGDTSGFTQATDALKPIAADVAATHVHAGAVDDLTKAGGGGDLAAVLGDTNELQGEWADGGRLDLILDASGGGGSIVRISDPNLACFQEGTVAVSSVAIGLPAAILESAGTGHVEVTLSVETDQIRVSLKEGGTPATGTLFDAGDKFSVSGPNAIKSLRMVRVTGDATVRWHAFRRPV